jgi:hypothetical protein
MKHVHKHGNVTITIETDELPEIPMSANPFMSKGTLLAIIRALPIDHKVTAVMLIRSYCNTDLRDSLSLYNDIVKG